MMTYKSSREIKLENRLREADEIIDALRNHKVDAVIGTSQVAMLRMKQAEDQRDEQARIASYRLQEIESIYQNVPIGLCVLDCDLKYIRVNEQYAKFNGFSVEEHLGCSINDLIPELAGKIEDELRNVIKSGQPKMDIEISGETLSMPGVTRHWLQHWLPLKKQQGEVIGINMVVEEITGRKNFEDKLQQLNNTLEQRVAERTRVAEERAEKLREMALVMTQIEENERQRLARVLHDGLQQLLTGAKLNTKLIISQLSAQDDIREQLEDLKLILDQSIESSRSLSYDLSPPVLLDEGILAALEWMIKLPHMKGLNISIKANDTLPELSQNLKVFLFHVVRELLINIIKHAETDKAEISISKTEQFICLEVIDEGRGFDVTEEITGSSLSQGLRIIRKKMELMNGNLIINSEPGRGSHFIMNLPISENSLFYTHDQKDKKS